ncbi:hypothetical protein AB4Y63_01160 [Leifsonia sp. YAF41]
MLEHRALSVGAIGVILVFAIENIVRGYLLNLVNVVEWWQYATPVFAASLSLAITLGLIVFRGTTYSELPVVPTAPRTWTSFSPRAGLIGAGAALVTLLTTTITAGMASSADDAGRYIYLEIPVPNVPIEALRPWFYGWSFGVPVIICLAALIAVTWATLRSNAARPYFRPDTVGAERKARVGIATDVVRIATAGMLLALGGAFRFIDRSGTISRMIVERDGQSNSYDTTWRYAEFATAAGWLAPALEITAFALLLFVACRSFRVKTVGLPQDRVERSPESESVR